MTFRFTSRFDNPATFNTVNPKYLKELFEPYPNILRPQDLGFNQPTEPSTPQLDTSPYVFVDGCLTIPPLLAEALNYIKTLSTPEGARVLCKEAKRRGLTIIEDSTLSFANIAIQVWLRDKKIFQRRCIQKIVRKSDVYASFWYGQGAGLIFREPTEKRLESLTNDICTWFSRRHQNLVDKVGFQRKGAEYWFLVRSTSSSDHTDFDYDPISTRTDLIVYDSGIGELRVSGNHNQDEEKGEYYRELLGRTLFDDNSYFSLPTQFNFDPFHTNLDRTLVCSDIEDMEYMKLFEIEYCHPHCDTGFRVTSSPDLLRTDSERRHGQHGVEIRRIRLGIKFRHSDLEKTSTMRMPNHVRLSSPKEETAVVKWAKMRNLIRPLLMH